MDMNNSPSKKAEENNNAYKAVYKKDIIIMCRPRPRRIIQDIIKEFVNEHNNLPTTKLKINLRGHTIPYCVYKKIVAFFENN